MIFEYRIDIGLHYETSSAISSGLWCKWNAIRSLLQMEHFAWMSMALHVSSLTLMHLKNFIPLIKAYWWSWDYWRSLQRARSDFEESKMTSVTSSLSTSRNNEDDVIVNKKKMSLHIKKKLKNKILIVVAKILGFLQKKIKNSETVKKRKKPN